MSITETISTSEPLTWSNLTAAKNRLDHYVLACEFRFVREPPTGAELQHISRQINRFATEVTALVQTDQRRYAAILFPIAREVWAIRATLQELAGHPDPGAAFRSVWARHRSFQDVPAGWDSREPKAYALRTAQLAIDVGDDLTLGAYRDLVVGLDSSPMTTASLAETLVVQRLDWRYVEQQRRNADFLSEIRDGIVRRRDEVAYVQIKVEQKKKQLANPGPMRLGAHEPGNPAPAIKSFDGMVGGMAARDLSLRKAQEIVEGRIRNLDRAAAPTFLLGFDFEELERFLREAGVEAEWRDRFVLGMTKRELGDTRYKRLERALFKLYGPDAYTLLQDDHGAGPGRAASLTADPDSFLGLAYRNDFYGQIDYISQMAQRRAGPLLLQKRHSQDCEVHGAHIPLTVRDHWMDCNCPIWITGRAPDGSVVEQDTGKSNLRDAEAIRDTLIEKLFSELVPKAEV